MADLFGWEPEGNAYQGFAQRIPRPNEIQIDDYPTAAPFTQALLDKESRWNRPWEGGILEPAANRGLMAAVLKTTGCPVYQFDKYPYENPELIELLDFVDCMSNYGNSVVSDLVARHDGKFNIVTNPPFGPMLLRFWLRADELMVRNSCTGKIAMLMPMEFLRSRERCERIFTPNLGPDIVYSFTERCSFFVPDHPDFGKKKGMNFHGWFTKDYLAGERVRGENEMSKIDPIGWSG